MIEKNSNNVDKTFINLLAVGGIAGGIEGFFAQPWWAWKTRKQFFSSRLMVYCDLKKLASGTFTNVFSRSIVTAANFITKSTVINDFFETDTPTVAQNCMAVMFSGAISSVISSPTELVATQQQIGEVNRNSKSFFKICSQIMREHGVIRFTVGLPCMLVREMSYSLAVFVFTPLTREKVGFFIKNDLYAHIISSIFSGVFSAFISHPFDTLKTIQHSRATLKNKKSFSFFQVGRELFRDKGVKNFWNGFFFRSIRVSQSVAILSYVTNELKNFFLP